MSPLAPLDPAPPGAPARWSYPVTLDRTARRRLDAQVRTLAGLPSVPGLVAVIGGGVDGGRPYVVGVVALDPVALPLPLDDALAAVLTVLAALDGLHRHGVVHGGVHPGAVLANGTAFALGPAVPAVLTERGRSPSPPHAAPEVLRGETAGPAADVFAAAATFAHLAGGRPPWPGADAESVLLAMASGRPPDLVALGGRPDLAATVAAALALDPAARPSAASLADRLAGGELDDDDRLDTMPPTAPPVTPGGRPLGSRYLLYERLGRGAMGEVHRGTIRGGDAVAVKLLREELAHDPAVVARFLAERTTVCAVSHPNLVRVHDLVAEGDTLAIVMDLVEGPDLRRWLRTAPPVPPATACRLLAKLADALAAVHTAGIVHRDLKPENVLLERVGIDAEPRPRLTDFGIARSGTGRMLTRHDQLLGTPEYLAPEVANGAAATPATDVYAFGVLAYELLCGTRPFVAEHPAAVLRAHAELAPARPPGIDDGLWALIDGCLAKNPADRPTAATLAAGLEGRALALEGAPPLERFTSPSVAVPAAWPASPSPVGRGGDGALDTAMGTALPPARPPGAADDSEQARRRRRRRYALGLSSACIISASAGVVLAAGHDSGGAGTTTSTVPASSVRIVNLVTAGDRVDPSTIRLQFDPVEGATRHLVVRDPQDGGVQLEVTIAAGAGFVDVPDEENDVDHCYLVVAQVVDPPGSSTTTSSPTVLAPHCTEEGVP